MNNKAKPKKTKAGTPKLQDFLSRLPKDVDRKETRKGTVLRYDKLYLMHVKQSPKGILHFLRTKTGKHLESDYATTEKEIDALLQEISNKIDSGAETKSASKGKK